MQSCLHLWRSLLETLLQPSPGANYIMDTLSPQKYTSPHNFA